MNSRLITLYFFSNKTSDNFSEEFTKSFRTNCKLRHRCDKISNYADPNIWQDFYKRFFSYSEYSIVIASSESKNELTIFLDNLFNIRKNINECKNNLIFVIIGDLEFSYGSEYEFIKFSNHWICNIENWKMLLKMIHDKWNLTDDDDDVGLNPVINRATDNVNEYAEPTEDNDSHQTKKTKQENIIQKDNKQNKLYIAINLGAIVWWGKTRYLLTDPQFTSASCQSFTQKIFPYGCAIFSFSIVATLSIRLLGNLTNTSFSKPNVQHISKSIYNNRRAYHECCIDKVHTHTTTGDNIHAEVCQLSIVEVERRTHWTSFTKKLSESCIRMLSKMRSLLVTSDRNYRVVGFKDMLNDLIIHPREFTTVLENVPLGLNILCFLCAVRMDFGTLFAIPILIQSSHSMIRFISPKQYKYQHSVLQFVRDTVANIFKPKKTLRKRRTPGALKNTAETCYMNSMIQAMGASEKLIEDMQTVKETNKLTMLIDIIDDINSAEERHLGIDDLTGRLKEFMNTVQWNRKSQQDAFQLLSFFINSIHNDIGNKELSMPPKLKILHTFSEDSKFNKIQQHLAISVPLCGNFSERPGADLIDLLNAFFEPSEIDDGEFMTTMFLYEKAPTVMILHIQANEWSPVLGEYIKPKYFIKYEDKLKYTFKIQKKKDGSESEKVIVSYKLVAVVHHMGSVSGGHYITYRMLDGQWFLTNDEQVERIDFRYDIVPYIMVYEKIESQGNVLQHLRVNNCLLNLVHILDRHTLLISSIMARIMSETSYYLPSFPFVI